MAGLALLVVPAGSQAGTVLDPGVALLGLPPGHELVYEAGAGEVNRVDLSGAGDRFVITDSGAQIAVADSAADRCERVSANQVTCGVERMRVRLGDGDDTAAAHGSRPLGLEGGAGNDVLSDDVVLDALAAGSGDAVGLVGEAGDDRLNGGPSTNGIVGGTGNDVVRGGGGDDRVGGQSHDDVVDGGPGDDSVDGERGDDVVRGGAGNDFLDGAAGRDDIGGGPGRDLVSYNLGSRSRPVSVTLDGRANDGPRGRSPELVRADVEDVSVGGPARGSNRVVGNGRANKLTLVGRGRVDGGGGGDTIETGTDRALGGPGNDTIIGSGNVFGGPGDDILTAESGTFRGGPGNDRIEKAKPSTGSARSARLLGETGNDTIDARDTVCLRSGEPGKLFAVFGGCPTRGPATPVTVRDQVFCGAGSDAVTLGGRDVADRTCERVTRRR
jgi:Ca2+-binding RTX toxin-like protein